MKFEICILAFSSLKTGKKVNKINIRLPSASTHISFFQEQIMEGQRVFVWGNRAWNGSTADIEKIDFGIVENGRWKRRVRAYWPDKGSRYPLFHIHPRGYRVIARCKKLADLVESMAEVDLHPEQFAIILAESGFADFTIYTQPDATIRGVLQRELRNARELVDSIEDRLGTGNYPH